MTKLEIKFNTDLTSFQLLSIPKLLKYCVDYIIPHDYLEREFQELGLGLPEGISSFSDILSKLEYGLPSVSINSNNRSIYFPESSSNPSGPAILDYLVIRYMRNCISLSYELGQYFENGIPDDFEESAIKMSQSFSTAAISIINYLNFFFMHKVWESGDEVDSDLLADFSPSHTFLSDVTRLSDWVLFLWEHKGIGNRNQFMADLVFELSAIVNHASLCALITDYLANCYALAENKTDAEQKKAELVYSSLWDIIQGYLKGVRVYRIDFPPATLDESVPVEARGQDSNTTRMKIYYSKDGAFYVLRFDCSHKGEPSFHINLSDENGNPVTGIDHLLLLSDDSDVPEILSEISDYIYAFMWSVSSYSSSKRDDDRAYMDFLKAHRKNIMSLATLFS